MKSSASRRQLNEAERHAPAVLPAETHRGRGSVQGDGPVNISKYVYIGNRRAHRVVVEAMLGRPLRKGEVVHHRNGKKNDNRPENLQVCSSNSDHMRRYHARDAYWTDEMDRQLERLRRQEYSRPQIAAVMGLSPSAVGNRVRRLVRQGRMEKIRTGRKRQEECKRGHRLVVDNLYVDARGERSCRVCRNIAKRAYARRVRSSAT